MAVITISPDFRTIQVPTGLILAVEGDQNVLTVNFTMARFYNGVDLSEYALKINYINAGGCGDIYLITDPEVQEEQILFNWTIGQNAAAYRGRLTFALEATKTDEAGTVTNELHTMPASIRVPATVDVCTGAAETALSDLLAQLMEIAGEAQESATEAAQSATQAARSEEQAGEYADRAEASAYNAGLAKEQAQAARTGAEAAQTAAESARTAASNSSTRAANSATAAAGSAQEAADSRTEAAAYINELAGEKINGDTVSYTAEAALPIEDLTIDIQGSQNLNGYRSPWVGGAGKNKFNGVLYNGQVGSGGTWSAATTRLTNVSSATDYIFPIKAGTYTLSAPGTDLRRCTAMIKDGNNNIIDNFANAWQYLPFTFTATQDGYLFFTLRANNTQQELNPANYTTIQVESGSTATAWEPYENIAPITAYTGRTITQQGKNLLENTAASSTQSGITFTVNEDGTVTTNGTSTAVAYLILSGGFASSRVPVPDWLERGQTYTISNVITDRAKVFIYFYKEDGSLAGNYYGRFSVPDDAVYYGVFIQILNNTTLNNATFYPMIEAGDTATEYEPYQHVETAVSWETEAGEVYKGTLNINTGVLTVTHKTKVLTGATSETWSAYPAGNGFLISGVNEHITESYGPGVCDSFDTVNSINEYGAVFGINSKYIFFMQVVPVLGIETVTDWRTWLSAHNVTIAFETTPTTYQLTPQEVRNLIGRQTLSANTGSILNAWIRTGEETWLDKVNESQGEAIEELQTAVDTMRGGVVVKYKEITVDSTTGYQFRIKEKFPEIQTFGIIGARVMFANGNRGSSRSSAYLFCSLTNTYNTDYTYLRICIAGSYTQVTAGTYIVRIYYFE